MSDLDSARDDADLLVDAFTLRAVAGVAAGELSARCRQLGLPVGGPFTAGQALRVYADCAADAVVSRGRSG